MRPSGCSPKSIGFTINHLTQRCYEEYFERCTCVSSRAGHYCGSGRFIFTGKTLFHREGQHHFIPDQVFIRKFFLRKELNDLLFQKLHRHKEFVLNQVILIRQRNLFFGQVFFPRQCERRFSGQQADHGFFRHKEFVLNQVVLIRQRNLFFDQVFFPRQCERRFSGQQADHGFFRHKEFVLNQVVFIRQRNLFFGQVFFHKEFLFIGQGHVILDEKLRQQGSEADRKFIFNKKHLCAQLGL